MSREGTLLERFCREHNCAPEKFVPIVMRRCIARRALPILWLMGDSELFVADRALVRAVGMAVDVDELRNAVDDYWWHSANYSWLRRVAGLRISTRRLRQVAGGYLPFGNLHRLGRSR